MKRPLSLNQACHRLQSALEIRQENNKSCPDRIAINDFAIILLANLEERIGGYTFLIP